MDPDEVTLVLEKQDAIHIPATNKQRRRQLPDVKDSMYAMYKSPNLLHPPPGLCAWNWSKLASPIGIEARP